MEHYSCPAQLGVEEVSESIKQKWAECLSCPAKTIVEEGSAVQLLTYSFNLTMDDGGVLGLNTEHPSMDVATDVTVAQIQKAVQVLVMISHHSLLLRNYQATSKVSPPTIPLLPKDHIRRGSALAMPTRRGCLLAMMPRRDSA